MCVDNIYLYTQKKTNSRTYGNQAWGSCCLLSPDMACIQNVSSIGSSLVGERVAALLYRKPHLVLLSRRHNYSAKRSQLSLEIQFSISDLDEEGLFFSLRLFLKRPAGLRFISQFQCVLLCSQLSLCYLATFLGYLT